MSEPFTAEIKIFAGNFAPRGFALCNGQLLPIAQNTALFSLIGTTYGGDGRTTVALPNLQGRAPMHRGRGPGVDTDRFLGESGGVEEVTLTEAQIPNHTHTMNATGSDFTTGSPSPETALALASGNAYGPPASLVSMASVSLPSAGGGQAHTNMQPFLTLNFIIALIGVYPERR